MSLALYTDDRQGFIETAPSMEQLGSELEKVPTTIWKDRGKKKSPLMKEIG